MSALQTIEKNYRRAEKAAENGKLRQAEKLFRQLAADVPMEPLFHWKLGYLLMESEDYQGAIKAFRRTLKLDSQNVAACGGLGLAYMELGKWSLAEKNLKKRLALKRSPQHYVLLAHVLIMRERFREAAVMCRRAIALDPSFSEAFLNLGLAYRHDKKPQKAVAAFKKAIELDRDDADAFRELGWTFFSLGDIASARPVLEQGLSLNPADAWAHLYLALCLEHVEDSKGAFEHFQAATKLEPDNPIFRKQRDEFIQQSALSNHNGRVRK